MLLNFVSRKTRTAITTYTAASNNNYELTAVQPKCGDFSQLRPYYKVRDALRSPSFSRYFRSYSPYFVSCANRNLPREITPKVRRATLFI